MCMNVFYRDLEIPVKINCSIDLLRTRFPIDKHTYLHKTFDKENLFWLSVELEEWLRSFNLHVQKLEIFHTEANRITGWHIDMNPPADWVKINWVYEEGVSHMEWADLEKTGELKTRKSAAGTPYVRFEPETTNTVCQHNLKGPTLINSGQPHRVYNKKDTDRWCLSIIPWHTDKRSRVLWDDAVEIFKDYLK